MSKRYFINNLDTPLGQEFYAQLVKEDTEEGVHMATYLDDTRVDVPKGFKKILKRTKPKLSRKKMIEECDVYVYELSTSDPSDLEYVCSIFKNPLEEQKVLVVVSTIFTWSDMQKKVKPKVEKKTDEEEGDQKVDEGIPEQQEEKQDQEQEEQEQEQQQEEQQPIQQEQVVEEVIEYVAWEETDYQQRKASPQYQNIKDLEDMVLSLQKENLKVIVVCSGIIYGKGEQVFQEYFKQSWLQDPYKLIYYGEGTNLIPTIHITDLVKMVIKVSESIPETNYVFAIDNTQDRSYKAIIQGISTGVGSGWIESVNEEAPDYFQLNLDAKASNLFVGNEENPVDFEWYCEKGIAANAQKILSEFTSINKLRPMKMLLQCETENMRFQDVLKMLSTHYRIPIITQQSIFEDARNPNFFFPKELLEDFEEYWPIIDEYMKSGMPAPLSEELKIYYKVIKWRLSQNDCANRGYILVNFPLIAEECNFIFFPNKTKLKMKKKPKKKIIKEVEPVQEENNQEKVEPEDGEDGDAEQQPEQQPELQPEQQPEQPQEEVPPEEEEQEEEVPVEEEEEGGPKPDQFFPESVIVIKPLDKGNKIYYRKGVIDFFGELQLDSYFIDTRVKCNQDVFENLRIYIERNGRPFNYLLDEAILIRQYFSLQQLKDKTIYFTKKQAMGIWKQLIHNRKESRKQLAEKHISQIKESESELERVKQFPFRNYLIDFVVPVLNEGLVEVAHILPDDPVEFLAEYLYKKSFE